MNPNTKYKFASELPSDFNGTLYFTNFSGEEFKTKWNSKEYTFPPISTVPLFIPTASPIETFNIRTMFAKQLADREFRKSSRAGELNKKNEGAQSIAASVSYTENELDAYINKCLEPLTPAEVKIEEVETDGKRRPKAKVTKIVQDGEALTTGQGEAL